MSSSKNKWRAECIKGFPVVSHRAEQTAVRALGMAPAPAAFSNSFLTNQSPGFSPDALTLLFLWCQLLTENRTQPITLCWVYPVAVYPPNNSCAEIILLKTCCVVRSPIIVCWVCFTGVRKAWILRSKIGYYIIWNSHFLWGGKQRMPKCNRFLPLSHSNDSQFKKGLSSLLRLKK